MNEQIDKMEDFFFEHPKVNDDGEPVLNKKHEVIMDSSEFSKLPLDKVEKLVKDIEYIKENQNLLG